MSLADSSTLWHGRHSLLPGFQTAVDAALERAEAELSNAASLGRAEAELSNAASLSAGEPRSGDRFASRSELESARLNAGPLTSIESTTSRLTPCNADPTLSREVFSMFSCTRLRNQWLLYQSPSGSSVAAQFRPTTYFLLLSTYYLLRTAYCLLLNAYY